MEIILGMLFLTFSNIDIQFAKKELVWKTYFATEVLLTTKRMKPIDRKNFAKAILNMDVKAFIVYMSFFNLGSMTIDPA